MSKASVEIAGFELIVEYVFTITCHGSPEAGPSYSSGGEPAEAAEFEIEVLGLSFPKQAADLPALEMPPWLRDLLNTHLYERDDINDVVQRADYEREDYHD